GPPRGQTMQCSCPYDGGQDFTTGHPCRSSFDKVASRGLVASTATETGRPVRARLSATSLHSSRPRTVLPLPVCPTIATCSPGLCPRRNAAAKTSQRMTCGCTAPALAEPATRELLCLWLPLLLIPRRL